MATSGGATLRPLWLLTRYLGTRNEYMSPDNYLKMGRESKSRFTLSQPDSMKISPFTGSSYPDLFD